MGTQAMVVFDALGPHLPANEEHMSLVVLVPCQARFRGIGIRLRTEGILGLEVSFSVEETVDIQTQNTWIQGAKVSGHLSSVVRWGLDKEDGLETGLVCQVGRGIISGQIAGGTRDDLAYQIFWACLRRSKETREWVAKYFPGWWKLVADQFGEATENV